MAKVAKMHELPVVFSAADQGPIGPIGPIMPEITEIFPDAPIIYRTKINSWHDPNFRAAIEATGRKQIIIAGIDASFCQGLPAKSMVADGYEVWSCIDCSGNISPITQATTIANLTQAGVRCSNWVAGFTPMGSVGHY
ncbi:isochorismatase family protein [Nostoc sp. CHAB 5715]|uniref:isochorismatase family protein n=1 Tax=Nostoc sp. CHAB 5715 TaxID=2780400 RepID=UPI00226EFA1A|nr:isochorismatase family protein [Nostoc sp. CHAB 5715]MCC5623606.1 isochorismatase family protein [Nostoc sp. CHAB 5715]